MRVKSYRGVTELILLIVSAVLWLGSLGVGLLQDREVLRFTLILTPILLAQAYFYFMAPEFELTEEALLIHEKWPLKSKTIPYGDIESFRTVGHRLGSESRRESPKEIWLSYQAGGRKKRLILCPEDADDFAVLLRRHAHI